MPIGDIRKLRPVHQFLKKDSDENILLDQHGVVQNVTEDFDDNDVVDTRHLIPTHILKFDSISARNSNDTVAWLRGDLAILDGESDNRDETGTYVYIGTDQDAPATTNQNNDIDWLLLTSGGQFNLSNQLAAWNPLTDYRIGDQVVFDGALYTVSPLNFPNTAAGTVVIPGNASNLSPQAEIEDTDLDDSSDRADWTKGIATAIQGVRADSAVQISQLPDAYTRDGNLFGVKFVDEIIEPQPNVFVNTGNYLATINATLLEKLLDRPPFEIDINNNQSNVLVGNPKEVFLKFNPNPISNPSYEVSTISYADLEESPAVFKYVFDNTNKRNDNLDFLNSDGDEYADGETKDDILDIVWVTGDQVIITNDTFDNSTPPVLTNSKGAYVYTGDTQETAAITTDADWQFIGINTLADTAIQSITIEGATAALLKPNGNVTIPADQIKAAYENNSDTNEFSDTEQTKLGNLPTTFPTVDVDDTSKEYILKVTDVDGEDTATWIEEHSVTKINELSDVNVGVDSGTNPGSAGDGLVMKWNNASTNWVPAGTGGEPWNTNVTYSSGDIVTHLGKVYVANTTTTSGSNPTVSTTEWDEIVSSPIWVPTADPSYLDNSDVTVAGSTSITIGTKTFTPTSGDAITIQEEGVDLATGATTLNFTGNGVVAEGTEGTKTITITDTNTQLSNSAVVLAAATDSDFAILQGATGTASATTFLRGDGSWSAGGSAIIVQEEGTELNTAATTINFTGDGVVASGTGATKTINIAASGATTALTARTQSDTFTHSGSTGLDNNDPGSEEILEVDLTSNSTVSRNDFWELVNNTTGQQELFSGFPGNGLCYNRTKGRYASVFFDSLFEDFTNSTGDVIFVSGEEASGTLSDKIDGWISAYNAISSIFNSPSTISSDSIVRGYVASRDLNKIIFTCLTLGVNLADLTFNSSTYSGSLTITDGVDAVTSGALTKVTYNIQGQDVVVSFPSETADGTAQAIHSQPIIDAAVTGVTITRSGAVITATSNGFVVNSASGITVDIIGTFSTGTYTDPVVASVTTGELITKDVDIGVTAIVSRLSNSPILYQALTNHTNVNANSSFSNTSEWTTVGDGGQSAISVGDIKVGNIPTGSGTAASTGFPYLIYTYKSITYYITINTSTGKQSATTTEPT